MEHRTVSGSILLRVRYGSSRLVRSTSPPSISSMGVQKPPSAHGHLLLVLATTLGTTYVLELKETRQSGQIQQTRQDHLGPRATTPPAVGGTAYLRVIQCSRANPTQTHRGGGGNNKDPATPRAAAQLTWSPTMTRGRCRSRGSTSWEQDRDLDQVEPDKYSTRPLRHESGGPPTRRFRRSREDGGVGECIWHNNM